jgi:hypothetical protein
MAKKLKLLSEHLHVINLSFPGFTGINKETCMLVHDHMLGSKSQSPSNCACFFALICSYASSFIEIDNNDDL